VSLAQTSCVRIVGSILRQKQASGPVSFSRIGWWLEKAGVLAGCPLPD
jgi:hypothetical protein